jgi:hypothetical protein
LKHQQLNNETAAPANEVKTQDWTSSQCHGKRYLKVPYIMRRTSVLLPSQVSGYHL